MARGRFIALMLLAPLVAGASTFDLYGFGSRGKGMGSALTAAARDYHAVYYNPAQLMERLQVHVGLGLTVIEPSLYVDRQVTDSDEPTVVPGRNMGVHLGISTPLGGVFENKLAIGVAFFAPLLRVTRAEFIDQGTPHFYLYENLPDKLLIVAGIAGQPVKWLKLGVGMQVLADLDGSADVSLSFVDNRVARRRFTIDLHSDLALVAGITVTPLEGLNLAVSYRQELDLAFRLPVVATIEELGALRFEVAGTSLYTPHQVSAGAAWRLPGVPLVIAADLTWAMWSRAPSPRPEVFFEITAEALQDPDRAGPKGGERPLVPLIDAYQSPIALGSVDVFIPRIGLEYTLGDFSLRAGYVYRPTPLPTPVHQTNYVDSDAHVATLGVDWTFRDPLEVHKKPLTIAVGFQATILAPRPVDKADPADETGSYTAGGAVMSVGVDFQHDF